MNLWKIGFHRENFRGLLARIYRLLSGDPLKITEKTFADRYIYTKQRNL